MDYIIDTHAHYDDEAFEKDRDELLTSLPKAGIGQIINVGAAMKGCRDSLALSKQYDHVFAALGVHPDDIENLTDADMDWIRENAKDPKVVAIGEIGLDYYYDLSPRDVQREVFRKQLVIAKEADIPMIIHERDATGDCLEILREFYNRGAIRSNPGVCHCCSMSPEAASEMVKMGFYIGVDGPLTFKNNKKTPEVVRNTPPDRIVIETDSPYLTPEPNRGMCNEPAFVPFVAVRLAEILDMSIEEVARITSENGKRLYEI